MHLFQTAPRRRYLLFRDVAEVPLPEGGDVLIGHRGAVPALSLTVTMAESGGVSHPRKPLVMASVRRLAPRRRGARNVGDTGICRSAVII